MSRKIKHISNAFALAGKSSHVYSMLVQAVSAVFGVVTLLCYTAWMDREAVGVVVLFITAATMLDMLRSGFIQSALVRFAATEHEEVRKAYLGSGFMLGAAGSVAVSMLLLAGNFLPGLVEWMPSATWYIGAWPLLILVTYPVQFASWKAQSESRFDRILAYRIVNSACVLAGVVLGYLTGNLGAGFIIWTFVAAGSISSLFTLVAGWVGVGNASKASRDQSRDILRFGRYSMTTLLGTSLLRSSDTFLIGAFLGTGPVAVYALAQKVVETLDLPLRALSSSVYPILAKPGISGEYLRLGRIIERVSVGYMLILVLPAIVLFTLAGPIVAWVSDASYSEAASVIQIFVVAAFLLPIDRMIGMGLDSIGRPEKNMVKVLVMLSFNVVGDILVLWFFGSIQGVAVVTVFMSVAGLMVGFGQLQPFARLSVRRSGYTALNWLKPGYIRANLEKSGLGARSHGIV